MNGEETVNFVDKIRNTLNDLSVKIYTKFTYF